MDEVYLYSLKTVEITLYGLIFEGDPTGALHLSLEPHNPHGALVIGRGAQEVEYPAKVGIDWTIAVPANAKTERDGISRTVLAWDFHGKRTQSDANEVFSLANLGLHGFRIVQEPRADGSKPKQFGKAG